jgi:hypothetical protein
VCGVRSGKSFLVRVRRDQGVPDRRPLQAQAPLRDIPSDS